ncbi:hypothetical protein EB796_024381 [Bugula neritina]|uniref:SUV39H2 n=1 Tax=Bugula neritina TaxID=10212 RepID=A0A7J7IV78_BUGNE|nr:hypothetical protein EB796_024381 [Bugula neritina]
MMGIYQKKQMNMKLNNYWKSVTVVKGWLCDVYLVKWRRWPHEFNTWEPLSNLADCEDLLNAFNINTSHSFPQKRKLDDGGANSTDEEDCVDDRQHQIQVIFSKLKNSNNKISSSTLVKLSGLADDRRHNFRQKVLKPTRKSVSAWATKKNTKLYREHKLSLEETLKTWETRFNSVYPNCKPITVENKVDLEAPPENFRLINDYVPMPGLVLDSEPVIGCSCEGGCHPRQRTCCSANSHTVFAYTISRKVRVEPGSAIYECNSRCTCDSSCRNRVVQHGSKVKLAIFKTTNGCGWGVKAKQNIKKGVFIMEYLGEIITQTEAENRGQVYDAETFTYLFDLDFDKDNCQFTIDARNCGNISHFVNHSCDPNMSVYGVWINNLDARLPRIALFANRDIKNGEELSFDYKMTGYISGKTPVKMSPFKNSPLQSPVFRKPLTLPDCAASDTSSCELNRDSLSGALATPLCETPDSEARDSLSVSRINVDGATTPTGVVDSIDDLTRLKRPTDSDGVDSFDVFNGDLTEPLADEKLQNGAASSSASDVTSSSLTTPSKSDFSCKNFRIVCHCGAKNCRKFLF